MNARLFDDRGVKRCNSVFILQSSGLGLVNWYIWYPLTGTLCSPIKMDSRTVKIAESPQNEVMKWPLRDAISLQIWWSVTLHHKNMISYLSIYYPVIRIQYQYRPHYVIYTCCKIVDMMCRAANNILCLCYELPDTTPLQEYGIGPNDLSICGRN